MDEAVVDLFGYHAVQLGLPELDALRSNRMPHRWLMSEVLSEGMSDAPPEAAQPRRVALHGEFDALPFPAASIDLLVLPHALELSRDPHQTLREAERVLVPEGRLLIAGLNPASLWGLRQRAGHLRRGLGLARREPSYLPEAGDFLGYWRLRDWLRLLSFEVEAGRFGCWRPPLKSQAWLDRWGWMDELGDRWWPVLGAVYFVSAVKRVRGMRLVGLAKTTRRNARAAQPVVTSRRRPLVEIERTGNE